MKRELWVVITVVAMFMGLMIGYSVPPMLEVGLIGGDKSQPGISTEMSEELDKYYQQLGQDNE